LAAVFSFCGGSWIGCSFRVVAVSADVNAGVGVDDDDDGVDDDGVGVDDVDDVDDGVDDVDDVGISIIAGIETAFVGSVID